jgi:hypothetical protein
MILPIDNNYCEKCGKEYVYDKWCKPCQISNLKFNFTNWTSGNKKIDDFIQEMQLEIEINDQWNIVFEWIPYSQFNNIKEIGKSGFVTVYSATWKDGPLITENYKRSPDGTNKKIVLKCLQNTASDKILYKVLYNISINKFEFNI